MTVDESLQLRHGDRVTGARRVGTFVGMKYLGYLLIEWDGDSSVTQVDCKRIEPPTVLDRIVEELG